MTYMDIGEKMTPKNPKELSKAKRFVHLAEEGLTFAAGAAIAATAGAMGDLATGSHIPVAGKVVIVTTMILGTVTMGSCYLIRQHNALKMTTTDGSGQESTMAEEMKPVTA